MLLVLLGMALYLLLTASSNLDNITTEQIPYMLGYEIPILLI